MSLIVNLVTSFINKLPSWDQDPRSRRIPLRKKLFSFRRDKTQRGRRPHERPPLHVAEDMCDAFVGTYKTSPQNIYRR